MSDDFGDRSDNSPAMRSFEEWLDQQAKQQGISREELFERLISSYWTLNEMVQLLDDSDNNTSIADLHTGDRSTDEGSGAVSRGGHSRETDAEDPQRTRWSDRPNDRRPDPQEDRRRESQDGQRRESQNGRRREQPERSAPEDRTDPDRLANLRERVDKLESELAAEKERGQSLDELTEVLASRLTGLEADIEELEATQESLSGVDDDLAERLTDLETTLENRQDQLASEQKQIRSRLHSEFNDLETILEHLVSQTDELDAQITDVEGRYDEELSQLRWERDALRSLKREAAAHDVHAGECEACGERIDFDLLTDPYCQECNALLTGITEKDKWLFFSEIVVSTDDESDGTASNSVRSAGGAGTTARSPSSAPQRTHTDTNRSANPTRSESNDHQSSPAHRSERTPTQRQPDGSDSQEPGDEGRRDTPDSPIADRTTDAELSDEHSGFNFGDFDPDTGGESSPSDDSDPAGWPNRDE